MLLKSAAGSYGRLNLQNLWKDCGFAAASQPECLLAKNKALLQDSVFLDLRMHTCDAVSNQIRAQTLMERPPYIAGSLQYSGRTSEFRSGPNRKDPDDLNRLWEGPVDQRDTR